MCEKGGAFFWGRRGQGGEGKGARPCSLLSLRKKRAARSRAEKKVVWGVSGFRTHSLFLCVCMCVCVGVCVCMVGERGKGKSELNLEADESRAGRRLLDWSAPAPASLVLA